MGFAKGSISMSPSKDIPMLLQVLHAQFITHDQLRDFALLQGYEVHYGSFNWRVRRLVENGLLERHSVPGISPSPNLFLGGLCVILRFRAQSKPRQVAIRP